MAEVTAYQVETHYSNNDIVSLMKLEQDYHRFIAEFESLKYLT